MGRVDRQMRVLSHGLIVLVIASVISADLGTEDLVRQARALRQQQQQLRLNRSPLQPPQQQQQQRRAKPSAALKRSGPALNRGGNDNKRFSSHGLSEAELLGGYQPSYKPVPQKGYPEAQRDGARYDNHGNRLRYPNGDYEAFSKRSEDVYREVEQPAVREVQERPQYRYPKTEVLEERPVAPVALAQQPSRRQSPEYSETSRSDIYAPASGPAEADSEFAASGFAGENRNIEAAVIAGAQDFGIPTDGVYQTEDRLSFQIHGQQGPHSYKYGYDTGNGYNRQFRYEERDGAGYVKGRYGFFDKYGKLQVVNYSADPLTGFHAEGAGVPEYPH